MPTLSRQQLLLIAEAAEVLTNLREASRTTSTPKPVERISVVPGVADLLLTGNRGLESGFYVLHLLPQTSPEGVGESKSPA
ncbi:hypothetical protein [Streptomyces canus]|uniref:hypothetical protein n=1 Tax=Streptomyces canus TaxID=58343 RepID=UPI00386718B0|nr:hypothetical protein OH824_17880 [Streptomyces canus]